MNVQVRIQFKPPTKDDRNAMRYVGESLTRRPKTVKVLVSEDPEWLVVDFTMPNEAECTAMDKIERAIKLWALGRREWTVCFPKSEAYWARQARKAARRRERRKAIREAKKAGISDNT